MRARTVFLTLFCLIAAVILFTALTVLPRRLLFEGSDYYCFYTGDTSKDCKEIRTGSDAAALTRITLKNVCGESATYSSLDLNSFLASVDGEILFTETLSDSVNYYCKASLPYSVELNGQEINLHVCVKESGVTVGSPIIFGGY